jgi:predicted RNA binding protein YcfA (HicA-like mRNA interferase family)
MAQLDKLIKRLCSKPTDFTWNELLRLVNALGYVESKKGSTSGSRRRFSHPTLPSILLHQPHPTPILKEYQLKLIIEQLGLC